MGGTYLLILKEVLFWFTTNMIKVKELLVPTISNLLNMDKTIWFIENLLTSLWVTWSTWGGYKHGWKFSI